MSNLDGDLLWDPARGHARTLTLQGEQRLSMRQSFEFEQKTLEATSEFSGTVHFEMQLEDD